MRKAQGRVELVFILIVLAMLAGVVFLPQISHLTGLASAGQENLVTIEKNIVTAINLSTYLPGVERTYLATSPSNIDVKIEDNLLVLTPDKGFTGERMLKVFVADQEVQELVFRIEVVDKKNPIMEKIKKEYEQKEDKIYIPPEPEKEPEHVPEPEDITPGNNLYISGEQKLHVNLSSYFESSGPFVATGDIGLIVVIEDGLMTVEQYKGFVGQEEITVSSIGDDLEEHSFLVTVSGKGREPEEKEPKKPEEKPKQEPVKEEIKDEGKKLGEKIEDEPEFEVYFIKTEQNNKTLDLIFYHDSNKSEKVYVEGNVSYNLSSNVSAPFENMTLIVELDDGIAPEFELHVGDDSERFRFGKKIPKVWLKGKKIGKFRKKMLERLKKRFGKRFRRWLRNRTGYEIIDRDDDLVNIRITKHNATVYIKGVNASDVRGVFRWVSSTVLTTEIFAADPIDMEEAIITLPRTDDVTAIVECPDFNLSSESCPGDWIVTQIPFTKTDTHINFTVHDFSGYGGGNIAVINVQSYPSLKGNWTVMFNTTGKADLTISAVNGTNWTDYADSGYDLKFLEVKCGNKTLDYTWINGSVFLANYSCDSLGYETSKVLTTGKHTLEFRFGSDVDYAFNDVFYTGVLWNRTYDSGGSDISHAVAADKANNVIVTGIANNDYFTIKYDKDGTLLWNASYDGGSTDLAYGVDTDSNKNVVVAGRSLLGGNTDFFNIKYNSSGDALWNRTYDSGGADGAQDVVVDSSDNIVVAGYVNNSDYFTIKYNSSGSALWNRTYDSGGSDFATGVAVDTQDNVVVTGYSGPSIDFFTIKYDSSGNHVWNVTNDLGGIDYARHVATDSNDSVIVVGRVNNSYYTIKYDSNGNALWNKTYDSGGTDNAQGVDTDSEDNIAVTGVAGTNIFTIMYYSNGTPFWNRTYNSGNSDGGYDAAFDSTGDLLVTGYTNPGTNNYLTIKYGFNTPPAQGIPVLNSTSGNNLTADNLTVYPQNVTDPNNDSLTNITNWYKNGKSLTILNMPFDTNSNTNVRDYTPYANNGTNNGSAWITAGILGGAYDFDGVNDYIEVPHSASLNITQNLSISMWVYRNSGDGGVIEKCQTKCWYLYISSGGAMSFARWSGGVWDFSHYTDASITTGSWHHLAITYDSAFGAKQYIDGVLKTTNTTLTGAIDSAAETLRIGSRWGNTYFNGSIDEVRLYDKILTPQQIAAQYNAGASDYQTIVSQETNTGDLWYAELTPNDGFADGNTEMSNGVKVGSAPTQDTPILNSTSGRNKTGDNITVYPNNLQDVDGDAVYNITNWFLNGTSITVLNMPFEGLLGMHTKAAGQVLALYFEENFKDFSGYGNDGSCTNCPVLTSGIVGDAYDFDGVNDVINVGDIDLSNMTLRAWINPDVQSGNRMIIGKSNSYFLWINNNNLRFELHDGVGWYGCNNGGSVPANAWTQVMATWDGTFTKLYVNGVLVESVNNAGRSVDSNANIVGIGEAPGWSRFFNGTIDEVHIYNQSLTADEIRYDYKLALDQANFTVDYSPYHNDGENKGANWTSSGILGGAYDFDGVDDNITIADDAVLNLTSDFSLEAWVNPSSLSNTSYILDKGQSSGAPPGTNYGLYISNTKKIAFRVSASGIGSSSPVFSLSNVSVNKWTHIAAVYESSSNNLSVYINGSLDNSGIRSAAPAFAVPLMIGVAGTGSSHFNGTIDEVRIHNRSLTPRQIKAHYNAGSPDYQTIVSQELSANDTWSAELTPNDRTQDGETKRSNNLTIVYPDCPVQNGVWIVSSDYYLAQNITCKIINITNNADILVNSSAVGNASLKIEAENITVFANSKIDSTGLCYGASSGPGAGTDESFRAGGAGHGGDGGQGRVTSPGGSWYGASFQPVTCGSGGGTATSGNYLGGAGGGAVKIIAADTLTNNGQIVTDGAAGSGVSGSGAAGGGAGGSLWIIADTLSGSGNISARGGNGFFGAATVDGGGGGGGHVAVYYNSTSWTVLQMYSRVDVSGG
ncbi:hypothetical protein GF343_04270, partial [Candidatus Woesearchaeota archaeon]|nr:hypothetical protein [Candidatus Woesearchaeota archaeon]